VESNGSRPDDNFTHSRHVKTSSEFTAKYNNGIQDPHRQPTVSDKFCIGLDT